MENSNIDYVTELENMKSKNIYGNISLNIDGKLWHFYFSHYHGGYEDKSDPQLPELLHAYGRMQLDLDIFHNSKEECAKMGYLALKEFSDHLNKLFN